MMTSQPAAPTSTSEPSSSSSSSSPSSSQSQSQSALYSRFHAHPFASDDEYQAGLSSILGHPGTPTTAAELDANPGLVLNAKLFYFAQKHNLAANALDARGYVDWLRAQTGTQQQYQQQDNKEDDGDDHDGNNNKTEEKGQEPPYPSSFSAIIDLITSNKPVPGIEQIPDTVLEHGSSKVDRTPRRRKPWEKAEAGDSGDADQQQQTSTIPGEGDEDNTDKPAQTGGGLLRILQPNAIAPSGLLASGD